MHIAAGHDRDGLGEPGVELLEDVVLADVGAARMGDPVPADGSPTWSASSANFRTVGATVAGTAVAALGQLPATTIWWAPQLGRYLAEHSPDRDADVDAPMEVTGSYVEGLSRWSVTASRPALLTS